MLCLCCSLWTVRVGFIVMIRIESFRCKHHWDISSTKSVPGTPALYKCISAKELPLEPFQTVPDILSEEPAEGKFTIVIKSVGYKTI